MTDVVESANVIQQEECDFRSPDSENLKTRMAGSINYSLKRNAQILELDGQGWHRLTQLSDLQGHHYIRRDSAINTYVLTNQINGSANAISINAEVYDENGISLGNLFSVPPSIDSAIDTAGAESRYRVGRYVEDNQDINAGANRVVGTLNFTVLNEGYFLRFFLVDVMTDGAGFKFKLWLRETA
jgi:hypothetical protein